MESPNQPRQYLTPSAAAKYVGVHPKTLQKWAREGKVRVYLTPGGARRYAPTDLDEAFEVSA